MARQEGRFEIFHRFRRKSSKKIEGGPFGEKNEQKVSMPEKLKGGPFSLVRYCTLRGKRKLEFWFRSLDQQVQFKIL